MATQPPKPRNLLIFGLAPSPDPNTPWPATRLNAALEAQQSLAKSSHWSLTVHTVDPSVPTQTSIAQIQEVLRSKPHWDVVGIGFGLRGNLGLTGWFERLVNVVVREVGAKGTLLGFPTSPDRLVQDSEELVAREAAERGGGET
ncbi:uncharacterized protein AB675_4646 [Cyphellophora attinorum]|uniref:Uncharacterized protein n=1 Tax=Cyphellophora attinorum TaxID=1664694 RepID=A0A0N0NL74_9EURO|nr:uncharacterized protein AB675_4646 [Phialophora attinorum]KPI38971.1 hypothetical protein AB675_4646 [Phialophora attinorum]